MYTLIPQESVNHLKKEYRIRVLILLFLFLSLGIWIGIVSLFPSYLISVAQEKRALAQAGAVEQSTRSASTTAALAEIGATNASIEALANGQDSTDISAIIEDISSRRIPGIVINDFEIGRTAGQSGVTIVIQGKAATRDALVSFKNNLDSDSSFSKVDLPVSDLAPDTDILFTMNITSL